MSRFILRVLVLLVSAFALALFAASAVQQTPTPAAVDPVERAVLDQAARFAHHQAMYTEPATADEPALMPGFSLLVGAIAGDSEPQLWQVRAIGLAATLLVALLIAVIVQTECMSWTLALASGSFALMAQCFLASPAGIARPESLMLALVLLGFMMIHFVDGILGALLGAIPLAAAIFFDSQAAWFVGAAALLLALDGKKRLAAFTIVAGLIVAAAYVTCWRLLGPWFNFNAWDEPLAMLRFSGTSPLHFVGDHLLGKLGIWVLAIVLSFAMPNEPWCGKDAAWMWLGLGAVVAGLASTQSSTFGLRSLLPSIVVLSLLGPIMIQRVAHYLSAWRDPDRPSGESVTSAAVLLQFLAALAAVPLERWLPGLLHLLQRSA